MDGWWEGWMDGSWEVWMMGWMDGGRRDGVMDEWWKG